ncbi:hypothetical protein Tco_0212804 [Tanacetum coccineum]
MSPGASRIGKQDAIDATLMGMLADPKEEYGNENEKSKSAESGLEKRQVNKDSLVVRGSWGQNNESGWGTEITETEVVWGSKKPEKETKKGLGSEGSGIGLLLGLIEGFYDQAAYKEFVKTVRFELVFKSIKLSMLRITEAAPLPFIAKNAVTGSLFPFLNSYLDGMIGSQPTSAIEFTIVDLPGNQKTLLQLLMKEVQRYLCRHMDIQPRNSHAHRLTEDNVDPDNMTYEELLELGEVVGSQSRSLSQDAISSLPVSKYKFSFFW